MDTKKKMNNQEYIKYLRNLKFKIVNGRMEKDNNCFTEKIEPQIKKKEERNSKNKSFEEALDDLCNLKLEISGGRAKKIY